jgi:threonine synthase
VAHGFLGIKDINVVVLYPAGKVSSIQEKQMVTLGDNITALRVLGSFDDCQRLVKQALGDPEVKKYLRVTSANSINISRLIPQIFYYFWILGQVEYRRGMKIMISVPSGNFGNLTAGLLAKRMGLPVSRFVAATNMNDTVVRYLRTGKYRPGKAVPTLSSAMDVGDPSNFSRILELYNHSYRGISGDVAGRSFNDRQTLEAIGRFYRETGYICDPHGAVGYLGLREELDQYPGVDLGMFLETAHPAKFRETVEEAINTTVPIPPRLQMFLSRPVQAQKINTEYETFREWLLSVSDYR